MQEYRPVTGTILDIFMGTLLVSAAVLTLLVARTGLDLTWKHAVLAIGVPVLAFPFWAIPLIRARHQAAKLASKVELLSAIATRTEPDAPPESGELVAATVQFDRAVTALRTAGR